MFLLSKAFVHSSALLWLRAQKQRTRSTKNNHVRLSSRRTHVGFCKLQKENNSLAQSLGSMILLGYHTKADAAMN